MKLGQYLDSTYLKTPSQTQLSESEIWLIIETLVNEAIHNNLKLVMLRPNYVASAKEIINKAQSPVLVGTVIGFHEGTQKLQEKLIEAKKAIDDGADELDFVINYRAFLAKKINLVTSEIIKGTALCLEHGKTVKWIIEIAALSKEEIITITCLIRDLVLENFGEENAEKVFVKSSTGFYKTQDNTPNGATFEAMEIIVSNAAPLKAKAAGGVKTYEDAVKMITLGVLRIGTSSAKKIIDGAPKKDK